MSNLQRLRKVLNKTFPLTPRQVVKGVESTLKAENKLRAFLGDCRTFQEPIKEELHDFLFPLLDRGRGKVADVFCSAIAFHFILPLRLKPKLVITCGPVGFRPHAVAVPDRHPASFRVIGDPGKGEWPYARSDEINYPVQQRSMVRTSVPALAPQVADP